MRPARIAFSAFLALMYPVAALVFSTNAWAASGNVQICNPSASCTVGEFVYDDSYSPITTATCGITSRYPDGTLLLNNVNMPVSAEGDGWYAHTFTAPTTLGLYRTEVKCTVGSDTMALDKSFEVQAAPSTLTSNDVASAVWNYSTRSLSTFGTLIADIWSNATRTVTGFDSGSFATQTDVSSVKTEVTDVKSKADDIKSVADKIKDLIDQLKPTTTTTNITNISNISQEIKNINDENRILLEQIINRPVVESAFDFDFSLDFQSKINETEKNTDKLLVQTRYLKSKTAVLDHKWSSLGGAEISDRLTKLTGVTEGIVESIASVKSSWNWQAADNTSRQARAVNAKILALEKKISVSGKSKSSQQELKNLYQEIAKLETSIEKNLLAQVDKVNKQAHVLDTKSADADQILASWNPLDLKGISKKIAGLAKEVSAINVIPKVNNLLAVNRYKDYSGKELKNKVLGIKGVLSANKKFLASEPGKPVSQMWLEEGSIVFKILVTNPSSKMSQEVLVKYYLPAEVKRENIVSIDDGLTVNFDAEKDIYYVSGKFKLAAGESETLSVTVDDNVFHIPDGEIASMRKQTDELSRPLENTAYFAQGTVLKSDIHASLDKIESLQKNGITPEAKIRAYREGQIEYTAAKNKLEKLKELATSAGSVGTLFGFVGGAQALAVWGLIIVIAAGFVFLTLYLRSIRNSEVEALQSLSGTRMGKASRRREIEEPVEQRRPIRHYKIITGVLVVGMGLSFLGGVAVTARFHAAKPLAEVQEAVPHEEAVLGSEAETPQEETGEEVMLFVPEETAVSLHNEPTLDSPVLTTVETSQTVIRLEAQDGWVKIVVGSVSGWIDEDFIEEKPKEEDKPRSQSESSKFVTITDTPTGFLRVRSGPWGKEIAKVSTGDTFPVRQETAEWLEVEFDDGTLGWIYKAYTNKI